MNWYVLNKDCMATLCASEQDARDEAEEYDRIYPARAPHTATQLVTALEVDAMRKDAERYRWLRNHAIDFPYDADFSSPWCVYGTNAANDSRPIEGHELDVAIDTAKTQMDAAMNGANAQ